MGASRCTNMYQYRQIRISTAFQSGMPRHCRIRAAPGTSPSIELHQMAQRSSIAVLLLVVVNPSKACTSTCSHPLDISAQCTVAVTIEFVLARAAPTETNNLIAHSSPQQYAFILSGYGPRMCLRRINMQQACGRSANTPSVLFAIAG